MKHNRILSLSVIALMASNAASAAITLSASGSDSALTFAKELPATTTSLKFATADQKVTSLAPTGVKTTPTNPVYVKFFLLGGAKFGTTAPTLTCNSALAVGDQITTTRTLGGLGSSAVTFQLTPAAPQSASLGSACKLTIYGITAMSGLTNKSISAVVEYSDAGVGKTLTSKGKLVTFTQALKVTYSPKTSPVKIDVAQNSKKFIDGSTNKNTALLGTISYGQVGTVRNKTGGSLTVASALTTVNLSISGPTVASVFSGTKLVSGIYLKKASETCSVGHGAITTKPSSSALSGSVVTFKGLGGTALLNGVDVCLVGDGKHVLNDGQISANLVVNTAGNSHVPDLTATNNSLALLKKNGSSTKALVIPDSSKTDKAFVRIYNVGSATGRVLGSLYGVDGKLIGSGVLSTSLAPNGVLVVTATDLEKAFGLTTPWTGRPWLQIEAEFTGLRAQALIRSSTGVLTEFSDGACTSATLCGDN